MELQSSLAEESPVVTLKNGTQYSRTLVKNTMKLLHELVGIANGGLLANDLVLACHLDENHRFFDGCQRKLIELGFLDLDGVIKPSVRDIVLSAINGESSTLSFISPIRD